MSVHQTICPHDDASEANSHELGEQSKQAGMLTSSGTILYPSSCDVRAPKACRTLMPSAAVRDAGVL